MDKYIDNFSRQQKKAKIPQSRKLKSTGVPTIQRQMYLDLGQKLFGKNKECPKCGMFYVIGDTDDECRHSRLCAKVKIGPTLSSVKDHRLLSDCVEIGTDQKAVIIEVRRKASGLTSNIVDVLKVVEKELGSPPDYLTAGNETIYLCIMERTKAVVGCLVAEKVHPNDLHQLSATVNITDITIPLTDLLSPTSCTSNFSDKTSEILSKGNDRIEGRERIEGTEDNFESVSWRAGIKRERDKNNERPLKATLGVRQIWVHSGFRRKSVASSLVDAARKSFIFGSVVMRSHTAYSQPTTDGLNFALSYSQKSTIWSYK